MSLERGQEVSMGTGFGMGIGFWRGTTGGIGIDLVW